MKDLRIVIVSWNVSDLLEKNLLSLPQACEGLDWECVVVDNVSSDDSVTLARDVGMKHSLPLKVIVNDANLGFAKACNIGAKGSDARYVLFLNPDTESPAGSLTKLVKLADDRPRAGIFGPKLVYPNGGTQESVRRFPGLMDQLSIVLKIAHFFPWLPWLKKYFGSDIDLDKEQNVDQVMGACFLVRKELVDQGLGYDERYFIWMEEVDFCKTARLKGWNVTYLPQVTVIHHLGQSFAKEFQPLRQRYFTTSLEQYFAKWHPGWRHWLIALAVPFGLLTVDAVNFFRQTAGKWFLALAGLELLSYLALNVSWLNSAIAAGLSALVFYWAWKKPELALTALFLELMLGSKGYLFQIGVWPDTVSLRIAFFVAFFAGWLLNLVIPGKDAGSSSRLALRLAGMTGKVGRVLSGRWQYLVLAALLVFAFIRGWQSGDHRFIFSDANAWVDLLLLIPVLDISYRKRKELVSTLVPIAVVGIFWVTLKTLLIEYVFSHGLWFTDSLYIWIRRSGVGEITFAGQNVWRVFFQSHVFEVAAMLLSLAWILSSAKDPSTALRFVQDDKKKNTDKKIAWWVMVVSGSVLLIGLSRSFWMGAAVGLVLVGILTLKQLDFKKAKMVVSAGVFSVILVLVALLFPIPYVAFGSFADAVIKRANMGEEAAVSRWKLLPKMWEKISEHPILGSGFGATVTYESKDPRVVQSTGGTFETYAFEWGWLEHWIKFGVLGVPVMLWILISLGWRIWRTEEPRWLRVGAVSSLFALAVLHFFTPYLNHPLGFAFLFLGEGMVESVKPKS
ncbi:MAG: glycosyltransferase [Patescibacteria group bacterium]|nr:glycosyltransferase [Patescibacteria group bacterium]